VVDQLLRHAAEREALRETVTACRDRDHVRAGVHRLADDRFGGRTVGADDSGIDV
jgi:hypothetical protein